jgi:hypothetical protein
VCGSCLTRECVPRSVAWGTRAEPGSTSLITSASGGLPDAPLPRTCPTARAGRGPATAHPQLGTHRTTHDRTHRWMAQLCEHCMSSVGGHGAMDELHWPYPKRPTRQRGWQGLGASGGVCRCQEAGRCRGACCAWSWRAFLSTARQLSPTVYGLAHPWYTIMAHHCRLRCDT